MGVNHEKRGYIYIYAVFKHQQLLFFLPIKREIQPMDHDPLDMLACLKMGTLMRNQWIVELSHDFQKPKGVRRVINLSMLHRFFTIPSVWKPVLVYPKEWHLMLYDFLDHAHVGMNGAI